MVFRNREDAAAQLAERLAAYRDQQPLVLGVPRGAVPMASLIAGALEGDLDVVLVHKLRAPGQPELAIGAVDEAGVILKGRYFDMAEGDYVREEVRTQRDILKTRRELYTRAHPAIDPAGRLVIIVDDGVATGSSMVSAVHAVRAKHPRRIVIAVAVAPASALARMRAEADDVVCLHPADDFMAVGQYFEDFSEVTDEMVVETLARHRSPPPPHARVNRR